MYLISCAYGQCELDENIVYEQFIRYIQMECFLWFLKLEKLILSNK